MLSTRIKYFIAAAALALIGVFVYINWQKFTSSADVTLDPQLVKLNNDLLNAVKPKVRTFGRRSRIVSNTANAISIAQRRKDTLKNVLVSDPGKFLAHVLPQTTRSSLPAYVQPYLEKNVQIDQAKLTVIHSDDFVNKKSTFGYSVENLNAANPSQAKSQLYFAKNAPILLTGSEVTVSGIGIDSDVAIDDGQGASSVSGTSFTTKIRAAPMPSQNPRVLVIMYNFSNDTSQPFTAAQVSSALVSSDPKSVATYYKENSFNQTAFSGDVVGWYTIPHRSDNCGLAGFFLGDWIIAARQAAISAGINVDSYNVIAYFTFSIPCTLNSIPTGTVGGNPAHVDYRITPGAFDPIPNSSLGSPFLFTMAHELGHNLGLHHANALLCGVQAIDIIQNCSSREYEDGSDVMGTGGTFHFNFPHKAAMGWIPTNRIQTVAADGTYDIAPVETSTSSLQGLKISKADTAESYYISFRKAIGFDTLLSSTYREGATIHSWNDRPATKTHILCSVVTLSVGVCGSYSLQDEEVFYDHINSIAIGQVEHNADNVKVMVKFGVGQACARSNPSIRFSPESQNTQVLVPVTVQVFVKNNNSSGCIVPAKFDILETSRLGSTSWNVAFNTTNLTLNPAEEKSVNMTLTPQGPIADGTYNFTFQATSTTKPNFNASATFGYVFNELIDKTPPTVEIKRPGYGATGIFANTGNVFILANLQDDQRLSKAELYINRQLQDTVVYSPTSTFDYKSVEYKYQWKNPGNSRRYDIEVKAYDLAGNVGSATIAVKP